MGHDYIECKAADCQLCQGYEDGYSAGQATLAQDIKARPRPRQLSVGRGRKKVVRRAVRA